MRARGDARGRAPLQLAIPDAAGYEAVQSMLTGEYTEESTGARTIRQTGGKDRHSKVFTSRGPRDRRVRLSVATAIRFYDLQDRLGFEQPSKAVEWLLLHCQPSIKALPQLGSLHRPEAPIALPHPSRRSAAQPPAFHWYQPPDVKPAAQIVPSSRNSTDFHSRLCPDGHLRHRADQLKSLAQLNQPAAACSLPTDSPGVLDTHSVASAHGMDTNPGDGDPTQSSHRSSSAGSSSNPTASFSIKFPREHLDDPAIDGGSQSYSLHAGFGSSCSPAPFLIKNGGMHASLCFPAAPDPCQSDNYRRLISNASGPTANHAIFAGNDNFCPTQITTLERTLAKASWYDDISVSMSSNSAAMSDALIPAANQPALHNNVSTSTDLASLCMERTDAVLGSSLQGIRTDMHSMQAVMAERLKAAAAADPNHSYMGELPKHQTGRRDATNAVFMSNYFKGGQIEHSMITVNANLADGPVEIYRKSGINTMNVLSPSESNNIISNHNMAPLINCSSTSTANNNLASATAGYSGISAQDLQALISASQF